MYFFFFRSLGTDPILFFIYQPVPEPTKAEFPNMRRDEIATRPREMRSAVRRRPFVGCVLPNRPRTHWDQHRGVECHPCGLSGPSFGLPVLQYW
jgi:hypothetical protein